MLEIFKAYVFFLNNMVFMLLLLLKSYMQITRSNKLRQTGEEPSVWDRTDLVNIQPCKFLQPPLYLDPKKPVHTYPLTHSNLMSPTQQRPFFHHNHSFSHSCWLSLLFQVFSSPFSLSPFVNFLFESWVLIFHVVW